MPGADPAREAADHRARSSPSRSRRMQTEKRQQGEILVEMGALSPYNLERALVEQVEAKLFEMFSWADGKFMFKAGDTRAGGEPRCSSARRPRLILEGIRRHYDERPPGRGAGRVRAASTSALSVRSGAAPAGHDVRSRRARVHPEHRRQRAAGVDARARRDPARQGAPAAGGAVGGGDDPAPRGHAAQKRRAAGRAGAAACRRCRCWARRAAPPPDAPRRSRAASCR